MIDRIDATLLPQRTALNLRAYRQELLASNIANADTPHYKARDIDFKTAFNQALAERDPSNLGLKMTSGRHLAGVASSPFDGMAKYRTEYQSAVDGNTVNMDIERSAFADNAIHMEASLTFIRSRFEGLSRALQSN